ncbi:MAG: glycosyltransferase family 4 protein [Candidatus Falkowbacteria bacterium]
MKILHTVEQYSPSVGGMQEVVKQLSERLVELGHEVTVVTSYRSDRKFTELNGVKIESFKVGGNAVRGYEGEIDEIKRYQSFLVNSDFDIITSFAAQQWATDLLLPLMDQISAKKVFVPTGFSGLYNPQYKYYFSQMGRWMKQYDLDVFLSNDYRDINFARDNGVDKLLVIPNGASSEEFLGETDFDFRKELEIDRDDFLVLLVGSHTGEKGHKEVIEIFSQANLERSTLVIIANTYRITCYLECRVRSIIHNLLHQNKILIKTLDRKKTVVAYKKSDLFLFPSNIECSPLVLFEAMASRLPFLTTDVGNSKEIIEWSQGGLLLPTRKDSRGYSYAQINESADLLKKLHGDKELREKLAESGFKSWQEKFTWEKIAKNYEEQYKKLLGIL